MILARIRPKESNQVGESGRGQIIARAIQGSKSKGSVKQLLPICCRSSSFGKAPRCLPMVPDKNNKCRLLDGGKRSDFVIVAILLAFIHER